MLRNLISLVIITALFTGCINNTKTVKTISSHSELKPNKQTSLVPLTDSAKLIEHLDSLPKAVFPRNVSDWNGGTPNIYLAEFKKKKLFNLLYKRIPRQIGGALIDMNNDTATDTTL